MSKKKKKPYGNQHTKLLNKLQWNSVWDTFNDFTDKMIFADWDIQYNVLITIIIYHIMRDMDKLDQHQRYTLFHVPWNTINENFNTYYNIKDTYPDWEKQQIYLQKLINKHL